MNRDPFAPPGPPPVPPPPPPAGPPPFAGFLPGPPSPPPPPGLWGAPPPVRRAPRARRSDIRAAALLLLDEQPRSGYQIIQELRRRTHGVWRPGPGSVYPVLQQLEDERLVRTTGRLGSRLFHLTEAGAAQVAERRAELGEPWKRLSESVDEAVLRLRSLTGQLESAARQVGEAGSADQIDRANRLLARTRRELYLILAEDDTEDGTADGTEEEPDEEADAAGASPLAAPAEDPE